MFDARTAKLLAPGQHLTSPEHPGLRLEAVTDKRTWIYRYRSPVDNRLRQIKIGNWPAVSVHGAIAEWERLRKLRETGVDPAEERKRARAALKQQAQEVKAAKARQAYTVFDVCNDYWGGHVKSARAPKGANEIWRMFDTMLGDVGSVPAADLTRAQAFDLIRQYTDSAPVQAGKLRAELGAAWDYAFDAGRLPETVPNWWRLILRGKVKSKGKKIAGERVGVGKRVLSPEETGTLIRWLPNLPQLLEDVLTLYLWTAARGGEIVAMEGREIVQEGEVWWWILPKHKTKNARHEAAKDVRIPLFGRALAVVRRRRERYGESYLFPARLKNKVQPVQQKSIQTAVYYHQPYCQIRPESSRGRLPVTHWAPHDLRRTARTLLAALGCPDEVGESILGHMLPGVLGVYNQHSYDAERVLWLKRLSDHLEHLTAC
jgi:integrase